MANILASLEVGPKATAAARTPVVAKHRAACDAAKLSPAELACFGKATDTWSAIGCAPRMFPDAKTDGVADCKQVVARTRAAVAADMPKDAGSAGAAMTDKMMVIMETACREDQWPEALRTCVMSTRFGDMAALQKCNDALMPKDLQDKLAARMSQQMPR